MAVKKRFYCIVLEGVFVSLTWKHTAGSGVYFWKLISASASGRWFCLAPTNTTLYEVNDWKL